MSFPAERLVKLGLILPLTAICIGLGGLLANLFRSGDEASPDPKPFYRIVSEQLAACRTADYDTAYQFASSGIRSQFTRDAFAAMVRAQYGKLTEPSTIEFGPLVPTGSGDRAWLKIYLITNDRRATPCVYFFVKESGKWRVDGVTLLPPRSAETFATGSWG